MWWFIILAVSLPMLGWSIFDILGSLAFLGLVISFFGRPRLEHMVGFIVLLIYLPPFFLIIALSTDLWWSYECWTGDPNGCTYNTIFLPELHPGTPDIWKWSVP